MFVTHHCVAEEAVENAKTIRYYPLQRFMFFLFPDNGNTRARPQAQLRKDFPSGPLFSKLLESFF